MENVQNIFYACEFHVLKLMSFLSTITLPAISLVFIYCNKHKLHQL